LAKATDFCSRPRPRTQNLPSRTSQGQGPKAKDNNTAYITIAAFINHTPLLCLQFKIHLITAVNQSKHKVSIAITSDVVFPEKYYVENFPEIFHSGKISVAYFYILQYYIHIYILNIFNI